MQHSGGADHGHRPPLATNSSGSKHKSSSRPGLAQTAPIGQMQAPGSAAAHDRFDRPDVAELTIALATTDWAYALGDACGSRLLASRTIPAVVARGGGTMARSSIAVQRRTSWNPRRCWIALAGLDRPRPRPASTRGSRPLTRGCGTRPTRRRSREIVAVMRAAGDDTEGVRLRGIVVVLWRAGLRISEALALHETDLDPDRGFAARAAREGRQAPRGRNGPLGVGAPRPVARAQGGAAGRLAVLHRARSDPRAAVRDGRSPRPAAPRRRCGRGPASVRAAPAPARARG